MTDIRVPKLNNNDAQYVLVEWIAKDRTPVRRGDPLAVLETSKAAEEILAEDDGLLGHLLTEGADCEPGQLMARLLPENLPDVTLPPATGPAGPSAPNGGEPLHTPGVGEPHRTPGVGESHHTPGVGESHHTPGGPVITTKARALMERHGIGDDAVRALGKKIVRESDIESLTTTASPGPTSPPLTATPGPPAEPSTTTDPTATGDPNGTANPAATCDPNGTANPAGTGGPNGTAEAGRDGETVRLSRAQRATAAVVELSHRTIPPAYTVMKVDVGPALAEGRARTKELRTLVGPTELLVRAVAGLHDRFPLFFASPGDGGTVRPSRAAHVGVTFDVGKGLVIPVVRDAASLGLKEVSRTLLDFRLRAMRGELREQDLGGANIVLTLHNEPGVVLAIPIVHPGHTCALALAAPHPEVVPGEDGGLTVREVVHIGAAYDHRVLNGRDVILFLGALRDALAFPEGAVS